MTTARYMTTKRYRQLRRELEPWKRNMVDRFAEDNLILRREALDILHRGDWNWAKAFQIVSDERERLFGDGGALA